MSAAQGRGGGGEPQRPLGERLRRSFHRYRNNRDQRRRDAREDRAQRRMRRRDRRSSAAAQRARDRRDPILGSLARKRREWTARRHGRAAAREPRSLVPASMMKRWRLWRGKRHAARSQRDTRTILPDATMKRWHLWRGKRHAARAQRDTRTIMPRWLRRRWNIWVAGGPTRVANRREFYSRFVPVSVRKWWGRQLPPQRSRIRFGFIGSTLIIVAAFALLVYEPTKVVRGARFARMTNSQVEFAAYTSLVRAPGVTVQEISAREQLLRRANAEPVDPPGLRCGTKALQSSLSSVYGPNSIRTAVCAGYYGIARIRKTGTATATSIGYFAVDQSGRWRLIATVPTDASVEDTIPDGFPKSLVERWAKR